MIKYHIYQMFLKEIPNDEIIFISGNSKKSKEIIDCLKEYRLKNIYFNWQDKCSKNIIIHYDKAVIYPTAKKNDNFLFIYIGEGTSALDVVYSILSGYYNARSKVNDNNSHFLCI